MKRNLYYSGPKSDHFDGQRFFNPGLPLSDKCFFDVLRWRLAGRRSPWPKTVPAQAGIKPAPSFSSLRIICIGHSSLLIQVAGMNLLVDPVWSERASPFRLVGPRRRNLAAIALQDLPPIDAVLITHNHYDHMDMTTAKLLWKAHHPRFLVPLGNDSILRDALRDVAVTASDWWDSLDLSPSVRVTCVPSYHWSSRGVRDHRMALWGGFFLEAPQGSIYCAGDTAYGTGEIFSEIASRLGSPAVAILPIGAYAPRWFMRTQHVNPQEAVQIAKLCCAHHMLGVHWKTFPLTDEPYDEPSKLLHTAAQEEGVSAQAFQAGDTWDIPLGLAVRDWP